MYVCIYCTYIHIILNLRDTGSMDSYSVLAVVLSLTPCLRLLGYTLLILFTRLYVLYMYSMSSHHTKSPS